MSKRDAINVIRELPEDVTLPEIIMVLQSKERLERPKEELEKLVDRWLQE